MCADALINIKFCRRGEVVKQPELKGFNALKLVHAILRKYVYKRQTYQINIQRESAGLQKKIFCHELKSEETCRL